MLSTRCCRAGLAERAGVLQVRNRLYELLVNAISPELIIKKLTYELMQKLDSELKHEVCAYAAYFEHRIQLGQKAIIHLEAFVARFMAVYKRCAAVLALLLAICAERTRHAQPLPPRRYLLEMFG